MQPVPLYTVVPHAPHFLGATDASKSGMGGFCLAPHPDERQQQHLLWRAPFSPFVQASLVTADNPKGSLTINDLELTALILGSTIASTPGMVLHPHICLASDNTAAVSWLMKGSTTSKEAPAYLLHLLASLRRTMKYSLTTVFTPGITNTIADCCSRLFHLTDAEFLSYMNTTFPIQPCWKLVHPKKETVLALNCALSKKLQPLASPAADKLPSTLPGTSGKPSVPTSTATPSYNPSRIPYPSYKYLHTNTALEKWLPVGLKYILAQWRAAPAPISNHWENWTYDSHANSLPTKSKTPHIADMLLLGFFFLLRPGEYAYTDNANAAPFRICDTHLMINNRCLHP